MEYGFKVTNNEGEVISTNVHKYTTKSECYNAMRENINNIIDNIHSFEEITDAYDINNRTFGHKCEITFNPTEIIINTIDGRYTCSMTYKKASKQEIFKFLNSLHAKRFTIKDLNDQIQGFFNDDTKLVRGTNHITDCDYFYVFSNNDVYIKIFFAETYNNQIIIVSTSLVHCAE